MWAVVDWMARQSEGVLDQAALDATSSGVQFMVDTHVSGHPAAAGERRRVARPEELRVAVQDALARRFLRPAATRSGRVGDRVTLSMRAVNKTFAGQMALRDVHLDHRVRGGPRTGRPERLGEIHSDQASGRLSPARPGQRCRDSTAARSISATPPRPAPSGLRFVHQDLALVLGMSVLDNMMLGRDYPRGFGGRIAWRRARPQARAQLHDTGRGRRPRRSRSVRSAWPSAPRSRSAERSPDTAPAGGCSSCWTSRPPRCRRTRSAGCSSAIGSLRAQGHGVLLVSHHLNEVLDVADTVTVLRDGRVGRVRPRARPSTRLG